MKKTAAKTAAPKMTAEQWDAYNNWSLFADTLRRAAALAARVEQEVKRGSFNSEAASAALSLARLAVEDDTMENLRGEPSGAYSVHEDEIAWATSERLMGKTA